MKYKGIVFLVIISLMLYGCSNDKVIDNNIENDLKVESKEGDNMNQINIKINGNDYVLNLEDNETVREFVKLLPMEYTMHELNGNEKYVYMDKELPNDSVNIGIINKGDVMLYGDNCLVIFYKTFETSYRYTKIGHIDNLLDFDDSDISVSLG